MWRKAILIGIFSMLMEVLFVFGATRLMAAEQVTFLMDWLNSGQYVPFYVARDHGFFAKHGLDVTLIEGRGSLKSATMVDAKQVDYSYGDFMTAVQVMSKGGKNRAIAVGMRYNGGGYIFLKSSGIKSAKDLEGKRFGTNPADFGSVLLPAMAAASRIDEKKVVIRTMEPALRTPALFSGKIDFFTGLNGSSLQQMEILGNKQRKEIGYLLFKDMGLKAYGHVLETNEDLIKKNPGQVRRFVGAIFEAWAWSINHPAEAMEIFLKASPQAERDISRAQMEGNFDAVRDAETKQHGLGYFDDAEVKASVDVANRYLKLSPPVDYRITYTNKFVAETPRM